MDITKREGIISFILLFLFILGLILFQLQLYRFGFLFILALMLMISFLSENRRVFVWTTIAFLVGDFLFLYGDRLLDELQLPREGLVLISRSLLLIPILSMAYVTYKFKKPIIKFWRKPNWHTDIHFPFIWSGFHSVPVKWFLVIAIAINTLAFLPAIIKGHYTFGLGTIVFIMSFSIINSLLEEILWRGLILTRMSSLIDEKWAVVLSGIAFGFSHLSLGYSVLTCLGFSIGGMFYAGITVKSGSLIPAIIWHFFLNILMILGGLIPIIKD